MGGAVIGGVQVVNVTAVAAAVVPAQTSNITMITADASAASGFIRVFVLQLLVDRVTMFLR